MKRKNRLSTLIKRTLLCVLLIIVTTVLLVYFLDVYSPTKNSTYNKYDDAYWNGESPEGFELAEDLRKDIVKWDQNDKTGAYILPWNVTDPSVKKEDLTDEQIVESGRYDEEITKITTDIRKKFEELDLEFNKWTFIIEWDKTKSVEEWISERLEYDKDEYLEYHPVVIAIQNALENSNFGTSVKLPSFVELTDGSKVNIKWTNSSVDEATLNESTNELIGNFNVETEPKESLTKTVTLKFEVEVDGVVLNLQCRVKLNGVLNETKDQYISKTDAVYDVVVEQVNVDLSAYEFLQANTFRGTLEQLINILQIEKKYESALNNLGYYEDIEQFLYYMSKDNTLYQQICVIGSDYYELADEHAIYEVLYARIQERLEESYAWQDYYKIVLLGYGGLATAYPNQPAMTVDKENGNKLEFWFNVYLTSFKIIEKDKNNNVIQTWNSNPETTDTGATLAIQDSQKGILNLSYSVLKGQTDTYSTYEYAVSETNIYGDKLTPNYSVKYDVENNKILVWYKLEKRGIDYTYFPKYISKEKWDTVYLKRNAELAAGTQDEDGNIIYNYDANGNVIKNLLTETEDRQVVKDYNFITTNLYKLVKADEVGSKFDFDYYEYRDVAAMGAEARNTLYKYLYGWCGYTSEDLQNDNAQFSEEVSISKPVYSVAIEYELTEKGLNVSVPGNSIKEDPKYPLTTVDILPYFTATEKTIDGYTVIPDGSGAILEHNNGKNFKKYQKRVYTTDLTVVNPINQGEFPDLMFPMYAVVNENNAGILTYATSNAGQLQLTADISERQDSYNVNYFTAFLREQTEIILGTASYDKKILIKWTEAKNTNDIDLSYELLEENEMNYSAIAKKYREILKKQYDITDKKDTTTSPTLDIDVIGAYSYQDNFLGIPYTAKDSLTTFDQLNEMVNKFKELGVENINAFYLGWLSSGLVNKSFEKMKISKLLGSKDKFVALLKDSQEGLTVYPYVSFSEFNDYQESFGNSHYTTHGVDGDRTTKQPYDLSSNVYDKKKPMTYVLSPRYYVAFGETLSESYKKATDNYNAIAIENLGSSLSGDYKKKITTFKADAIKNQMTVLENLYQDGINNLTLYAPYDYAFKYTTVAKNIPYEATKYEILDYSIPFYQLVVNGMFDYSSESINAESGKGTNEHLMRMIETGSNMSFTFTGDSSEKLIQTDYNNYYYTLYTDWLNEVKTIYNTLNELGIYKGELVSHEYLGNNVFKVVYETSRDTIEIYLNYSRNPYSLPDGSVVEGKSYKKL